MGCGGMERGGSEEERGRKEDLVGVAWESDKRLRRSVGRVISGREGATRAASGMDFFWYL